MIYMPVSPAPAGKRIRFVFLFLIIPFLLPAQGGIHWSKDGNSYYRVEGSEIVQYTLPKNDKTVLLSKTQLTPAGGEKPLAVRSFDFSEDGKKLIIFTNSKRVWRLQTRGDYWVFDKVTGVLSQLGKSLPGSSLMFAKLSPCRW